MRSTASKRCFGSFCSNHHPGILFDSFIIATYEITMAAGAVMGQRGDNVSDCDARMLLYVLKHTTSKQFPYIETKCPS